MAKEIREVILFSFYGEDGMDYIKIESQPSAYWKKLMMNGKEHKFDAKKTSIYMSNAAISEMKKVKKYQSIGWLLTKLLKICISRGFVFKKNCFEILNIQLTY